MTLKAADDYPFIAERLKQFENERKAAQLLTVKDCPLYFHPLIVTSVYFHATDAAVTAGDFQTPHNFKDYKDWLRGLSRRQIISYAVTPYAARTNPEAIGLRIENTKILIARLSLVLSRDEFAAV